MTENADFDSTTERDERPLTLDQEEFARLTAYLRNATEAYVRVYKIDTKKTPRWPNIAKAASVLRNDPRVAARIKYYNTCAAEECVNNLADVMRDWMEIAYADNTELIQHRTGCCRHCHGDGFQYQWRDEEEWALAVARAYDNYDPKQDKTGKGPTLPDNIGGYGFNANVEPCEHCPRCDGRGIPYTTITDTDKLSGPAKRLYAGVKVTRDGLQVLMRDQDKALENLARALGAFTDNVNVKGKVAHAAVPAELTENQRRGLDEFFSANF